MAKLRAPTYGSSEGCVAVPLTLRLELREHLGRYYLNVYNKPYPAERAVRGKLHR